MSVSIASQMGLAPVEQEANDNLVAAQEAAFDAVGSMVGLLAISCGEDKASEMLLLGALTSWVSSRLSIALGTDQPTHEQILTTLDKLVPVLMQSHAHYVSEVVNWVRTSVTEEAETRNA